MKNILRFICLAILLTVFHQCIREDVSCLRVTYNLNSSDALGSAPIDARLYSSGDEVTVMGNDAQLADYTFASWNTLSDGTGTAYLPGNTFSITTNVTLYAQWVGNDAGTVIVTYDPNGGTGGLSDEVDRNSILTARTPGEAQIERANFSFSGWNTRSDGNGTTYMPGDTFEAVSDITLYAQWTEISIFIVTYNPTSGTGGSFFEVYENSFHTIIAAEEAGVEQDGYTFEEWNTEPNGSGTSYLPGDILTVTENITLYAQWQFVGVLLHQVTYQGGIGSGFYEDQGIVPGSIYTVKGEAETGMSLPSFNFVSWNTQIDGSGTTYLPGDTFTVIRNVTLYAQWQLIIPAFSTVVYNPGIGEGGLIDSNIPWGSTYTIKGAAEAGVTLELFTLESWNTEANGGGLSYTPGETITLTGNLILYARWVFFP